MKEEKINLNGKILDYHEASNMIKKDLVDAFRAGDELHKLCRGRNIACYISLVPYSTKEVFNSITYMPNEDKDLESLFKLTEGTILEFKKSLGIVYDFNRFDLNEIRK